MQLTRSFTEAVTFAPFRPEFSVRATDVGSESDPGRLLDVGLRFRAIPGFLPDPNHLGKTINDLHLYLGPNDITAAAIRGLRELIDDSEPEARRAEYRAALDRSRPVWAAMFGPLLNVEAEFAAAQAAGSATPFSNALTVLGDARPGHGGPFQLIHFLFGDVRLPPLRLSRVLEIHGASGGGALSVRSLAVQDLAFSPGPSPFRANNPAPPHMRFGVVELGFEFHHHNPNDDDIADLRAQIEEIRNGLDDLVSQFDGVVNDLAADGPIRKPLDDAVRQTSGIITDLGRAQETLGALATDIGQFDQRIAELRDLIQ